MAIEYEQLEETPGTEPVPVHPDLRPRKPEERPNPLGRPVVRTLKAVAPSLARLGKDESGEEILEKGFGLVEVPIEASFHVSRVDNRGRPIDPSEPIRHYTAKGFRPMAGVEISELNEASLQGLARNGTWTADLEAGVLLAEGCAVNQCWNKATDPDLVLCDEHRVLWDHGLIRWAVYR